MKALILLITALYAGTGLQAATLSYKLSEALNKKLVSVSFTGAKGDTSFSGLLQPGQMAPCMAMVITSTTADALNLNMEYGYQLVPDDSSYQVMMVSQTLMVKLQPKQKKNYRVYAMCTEATDRGPAETMNFEMGPRATSHLLGLAELINRKNYQNDAAQSAVWCLTNNRDLNSIVSDDTTVMYELRRFVAKAKNVPLMKAYQPAEHSITTRNVTYSGSLNYSFAKPCRITIALYDEDGKLKKTYIDNQPRDKGEHNFEYRVESGELQNKKHYVKLFRDGKLEEEISIIPHEY